jgi:hypothetical protein
VVLLDRYKVLDITAWGKFLVKVVNIFKILKIGCWAVLHLCAVSLGGHDVPGCNCTWGLLSAHAGYFYELAKRCHPTVLVSDFSEVH